MVRVGLEQRGVVELAANTEETGDRALAVRSLDPAALGPELEFCELRLRADHIGRREQLRRIDAVPRRGRHPTGTLLDGLGADAHDRVSVLLPARRINRR